MQGQPGGLRYLVVGERCLSPGEAVADAAHDVEAKGVVVAAREVGAVTREHVIGPVLDGIAQLAAGQADVPQSMKRGRAANEP